MRCVIGKGRVEEYSGDALISLIYENGSVPKGPYAKIVSTAIEGGHFKASFGELFQIYPCDSIKSKRLILVGLGKKGKQVSENIRKAAAVAIKNVQNLKRVAFLPVDNPRESLGLLVDGVILGNYRFDTLKSDKKEIKITEVSFFTGSTKIADSKIKALQIIVEGTCNSRDLSNLPGNILTPSKLADEAKKLGKKNNISVKVLTEDELEKLKMGALLAVGQGSANRPRMVVWEYKGGRAKSAPIVLVGKGVTFDSGGISLKPGEGMGAMKGDMGGAGTVISLIDVVGQLKPKVNIVGITPLVENMPSGTAYRPGDVVTASNGKTIEIISTDAEGRMILADALVYAKKFNPKYVIDIATLTGACMVALGTHICAGIMGTDQKLIDMLSKLGETSGERVWQLPLWDDYQEMIKTPAADIKNSGGRWGGAITAGKFLGNFAEDYPWAHLDIAGVDNEEGNGHPYRFPGATGWGVRLLSRFLLSQGGYKI